MTEPDEALLYAREHWATICDEDGFPEVAEAYRRGDRDEFLRDNIEAYRPGFAASAARIKELEAALAKANEPEWFFLNTGVPYPSLYEAVGQRVDPNGSQTQLVKVDTGRACKTIWAAVRILGPGGEWSLTPCATEAEARALLKETDQ